MLPRASASSPARGPARQQRDLPFLAFVSLSVHPSPARAGVEGKREGNGQEFRCCVIFFPYILYAEDAWAVRLFVLVNVHELLYLSAI